MDDRASRPVVLHLAVDVNTPQRLPTTHAIERLIEAVPEFDNVMIAYRRTPKPHGHSAELCSHPHFRLYDFPYFGLPLGIGLRPSMKRAAERTIKLLTRDNIVPKAVHAHKLSFEGLSGWHIARHYGVPLLVSLRGEVETKVFRRKPGVRPLLRRISLNAHRLYHVSAWFQEEFHSHVPIQRNKEFLLPNIIYNVRETISPVKDNRRFVCILNLEKWRVKGLTWLLDAFVIALQSEPALRLDIIGSGSPDATQHVTNIIRERKLEDRVSMVGGLSNSEVLLRLPSYCGLLMPSLNETFGMVFVEALFAGVPILYTKGTAIDGYIDELDIARTVAPRDRDGISMAILDMWNNSDQIRANIRRAAPALHKAFNSDDVIVQYRNDLADAVSSPIDGAHSALLS